MPHRPFKLPKRNLALLGLGSVIFIIIAAHVLAQPAPPHPFFARAAQIRATRHRPLVIAHQGGEGLRPSNTLLAFKHAMSLGVDMLDTDVHLSKDGVLVLIHDETVDRTTNGKGAVREHTLAELQALDAGFNFSPDGGKTFPFRGQGVQIPTLEALFQAYPNTLIGIEIKQAPPNIAVPFCALIRKYGMSDKVLISSFRPDNMLAFRRECPEIATSPTENEIRPFFFASLLWLEGVISPQWHALQVPEYGGGFHVLTPRFVAAAHRRGVEVHPWTINELDDLRRILALGVDGINTDYPDRMILMVND